MNSRTASDNRSLTRADILKALPICYTLAYVSLLPNFYLVFNATNRLSMLWDRALHASILSAIFLLGSLYAVCGLMSYFALHRWRRLLNFFWTAVLLFLLVRTFVSLAARTHILPLGIQSLLNRTEAKLAYYTVFPLVFGIFFPATTVRRISSFLLLVSPALLFLIFVPMTYTVYDKGNPMGLRELVARAGGDEPAVTNSLPSVFICIFDEWSYDRSLGDPDAADLMPNTLEIMRAAVAFTNAISAGSQTAVSIPRMLFPTNPAVAGKSAGDLTEAVYACRISAADGSIYDMVPADYTTILSGFLLPYDQLLDHRVDYVANYHDGQAFSRTFGSELRRLLISQVGWLRFLGVSTRYMLTPVGSIVQARKVIEDAMYAARDIPGPLLGVFHICLPHDPFVWDRDGEKAWRLDLVDKHTVSNYHGNVRYLDTVIRDMAEAVISRDEECLLVLTGDHGWRCDPDLATWPNLNAYPYEEIDLNPESPFRRVPLILYTGRVQDAVIIADTFNTKNLHLLIRRYLAGAEIHSGAD